MLAPVPLVPRLPLRSPGVEKGAWEAAGGPFPGQGRGGEACAGEPGAEARATPDRAPCGRQLAVCGDREASRCQGRWGNGAATSATSVGEARGRGVLASSSPPGMGRSDHFREQRCRAGGRAPWLRPLLGVSAPLTAATRAGPCQLHCLGARTLRVGPSGRLGTHRRLFIHGSRSPSLSTHLPRPILPGWVNPSRSGGSAGFKGVPFMPLKVMKTMAIKFS